MRAIYLKVHVRPPRVIVAATADHPASTFWLSPAILLVGWGAATYSSFLFGLIVLTH